MDALQEFFVTLDNSLNDESFVKLTLSKPRSRSAEWRNAYARRVLIKEEPQLSFTLRYTTRDETRNFPLPEAQAQAREWLESHFLTADLFTLAGHWTLQLNKKGRARLQALPAEHQQVPEATHDQAKQHLLDAKKARPYLTALGIATSTGEVRKKGTRKLRQINKYIEIIQHLLEAHPLRPGAHIVDMGSGKGYLTFALYDYLVNERGLDVQITGVELRQELVDQTNQLAREQGFTGLHFTAGDIHDFQPAGGIDVLIALHACDTATDEALAKGIRAKAEIIVVAPCCHKQVRKAMQPPAIQAAILRHGSLLERQAELLTDGIRSLLLEEQGYQTKVFEFVSTEHTPKNLMITATRHRANPQASEQIEALKQQYGIDYHHLERLLHPSS
ncbi:MAG: SAM-dependent methyltransferase [Lewinella sp.]|nr:SAM-dependent methyltransferase [Lewinella sp.]